MLATVTAPSGDRHRSSHHPALVGDAALYEEIRTARLQGQAYQWQSFATFCQYRRVFEITRRYLKPGAVALDWGCGNGHFSFFLARHAVRSVGYSFEDPPAYLAREPLFEHRRGAPGEPVKLPFAADTFDLVFSVGVLEHVEEAGGDARASIQEIQRVLKPGGHFLCFHLPNRYSWSENLRKTLKRLGANMKAHPVLYTQRTFSDLLLGTALEVVEARRYGFLPRTALSDLPRMVRDAPGSVACLNGLDALLEQLLAPLCQNWGFVLVKSSRGTAR